MEHEEISKVFLVYMTTPTQEEALTLARAGAPAAGSRGQHCARRAVGLPLEGRGARSRGMPAGGPGERSRIAVFYGKGARPAQL